MSDAQTWTTLIGLLTLMATSLTFMVRLVDKNVTSAIQGLRGELRGERAEFRELVAAEFGEVKLETRTGFAGVNRRLDGLDDDIRSLNRAVFGGDAA